ncbi:MAG: capsular polysaccharide export protein, LipB/KpsS family [Planctomycetota bacterium]
MKTAPQAPAPDLAEQIGEAVRAAKKGRAARACSVFDQVARAAGVPLALDRPVVLAVHQPWFDVAPADLTRKLVGLGYTPCWFDPAETLPAEPGHEDADIDLRSARHRDVSLWEVTAYDFCVRHELSLAEAEASLEAHADDLRREYARARALIDRAHRNFDVYAPECALIAQGHVMASAVVRAVGLARGVRVVAIENTFHSERLLWDDDAALPVVSSRAKSVWLRDKSQVSDAQAEAYVEDFLGRAKGLKSAQHASPSAGSPWAAVEQQLGVDPAADPRRRRIVLLGQVATDAAVLFGLRSGFTRQLDVIRTVAEHAEREGHTLVVKLHPKEATGASPLGIPYRRLSERQMKADPALAALMERGAFVLDADNALDTDQLSAGADVCVAVNSQAGLEALVRGSEVVLCGNAFYGGLGFTHEAEDPGSLEVALARALDGNSRRNAGAEAKRFFVTYLEGLCLPKTVGIMGALCATPRVAPASARPAPNAASAYVAPSREEREAYGSGERQTAVQFESIRADHRVRYDFATEWLTAELARARRGDGPLLGVDAFCGNGYGSARLASAPHVCVQGIDASEDAISVAQQHFGNERVQFEARRFPFDLPKERFDFATCFESIEHVRFPTRKPCRSLRTPRSSSSTCATTAPSSSWNSRRPRGSPCGPRPVSTPTAPPGCEP